MPSRRTAVVAGIVVVGLAAAGGYAALRTGVGPLPDPEGCTARVGTHSVAMSIEQAQNASIIAAVAERRDLPARAISIAVATAYQESKLHNVTGGDRDSLGLFQQRPSQGWGTPKQILNPYYAANAFYDALVQVQGYETMEITKAAQAVQRSAFPDAYADHEADGRTIASALSGYSDAAFSCVVDPESMSKQQKGPDGFTPRADSVRDDLTKAFGALSVGEAGAASTGRAQSPAHREGRAIDIVFRPLGSENTRRGWVVAQYLVANAKRLHLISVSFDKRIWTTGSSADGWRTLTPSNLTGDESPSAIASLERRDHVQVTVS